MDCGGFGSSSVSCMHQQKRCQQGHLQGHLHQAPAMQSRCERVTIHMRLSPKNAFALHPGEANIAQVCTLLLKITMVWQA